MQKFLGQTVADRLTAFDMISFLKILPNPDPVLTKLGRRISVYDDLLHDARVSSCMASRKAGITNLDLILEQGSASEKVTEFIKSVFENFDDIELSDMFLNCVSYGYQPIEITWKTDGSFIVPGMIKEKPSDWFTFDTDNKMKFLSKSAPVFGEDLPEMKFLCPTHRASYRNPFGISVLSSCFWPATFKKATYKFWVTFTEKYGTPWVVTKYGKGTSQPEIDKLMDNVVSMVQDAVLAIPADAEMQIVEAAGKGASAEVFDRLKDACNTEIATAILGQDGTTEVGNSGSYAAAQTLQDVRKDIVLTDARIVQKQRNIIVRWLVDLNFGASEPAPKYCYYEPDNVDKVLAERDEILGRCGVQFKKQYFAKSYAIDEDDFEVSEKSQDPGAGFADPAKVTKFSENKNITTTDIIAGLDLLKPEMFEPVTEAIIKAIAEGKDDTEIMDGLIEQYPNMDLSALDEKLTRAAFISSILGYNETQKKK